MALLAKSLQMGEIMEFDHEYLGWSLRGLNCKKLGINVDGYKLKDLRFADSENDLQLLIERIHDVSKKYGDGDQHTKNQSYDILPWRSTSS